MIRKLILALLLPVACGAQGVRFDTNITSAAKNVPAGAQAPIYTVPFARITVCGDPAASSPCTNTIPVYADAALTQPIPQPLTADVQGRIGFYLTPGIPAVYSVQTPSGAFVGNFHVFLTQVVPLALSPEILIVSQLGCAYQDVDLNTGLNKDGSGNPAHDDGPCISNALAKATAQKPIQVIQDGASLVSGVRGPASGNWSIIGLGGGMHSDNTLYGTGFYQKTGTNDDVIHNGPAGAGCLNGYSDFGWTSHQPAPARGTNIILRDLVINGNRGNGTNGNSTSGTPQGVGQYTGIYTSAYCWYMGIDIMDINNVDISGITFYQTSAYNLRLSNVGYANVDRSTFAGRGLIPPGSYVPQNGDGIHVSGPGNDLHFGQNYFATTDDAVALNAVEGWGGAIERVAISDSTVRSAASMFRAYTGSLATPAGNSDALVYNVTVTNFTGTANICAILGLETNRTLVRTNTMTNISWSDSTCNAPIGIWWGDNVGDIRLSNYKWHGPQSGGMVDALYSAVQANSFTFSDVSFGRFPGANTPTGLLDSYTYDGGPGSTIPVNINAVHISGVHVVDEGGCCANAIPQLINFPTPSTIGELEYSGVDDVAFATINPNPAQVTMVRPITHDTGLSPLGFYLNNTAAAGFQGAWRNGVNLWGPYIQGSTGASPGTFCHSLYNTSFAVIGTPLCVNPNQLYMPGTASLGWSAASNQGMVQDVGFSRITTHSLSLDGATIGDGQGGLTLGTVKATALTGSGTHVCVDSSGNLYKCT